ncbi:MAG: cytochrome C554 [Deltaproteobacteria bacterium]|nr:cytochrome C554 [Deltaproteobacteria bacterium]MBW2291797.1 cytochrome C554 [Deltaproteobacteria bacterium]MBW2724917.1 cytochrome C554 [Deltaproteobacteria bacterium]
MPTRTVLWLIVAAMLLAILPLSASAQEYKYTTERDCSRCHKKKLIGNQTKVWKGTKHSTAFATLKSERALEIAKELGMADLPHESDDCLGCHATAYGIPPEKVEKVPMRLKDGVQCESCHGPGSEYKGNEIMSSHEKSVAAGMWEPDKDEKICTACHNKDGPTFEGFDYEKGKEDIAHPIPEDVKGHYLELEEKNKKKKKKRRE